MSGPDQSEARFDAGAYSKEEGYRGELRVTLSHELLDHEPYRDSIHTSVGNAYWRIVEDHNMMVRVREINQPVKVTFDKYPGFALEDEEGGGFRIYNTDRELQSRIDPIIAEALAAQGLEPASGELLPFGKQFPSKSA